MMPRRALAPLLTAALAGCRPATNAAPEGSAAGLGALYRQLAALEAGRRAEPVAVLQLGDSHTANDAFSGRMRELFQARWGDAGRGFLPPGVPYRYYRPARLSVAQSGWATVSSFSPASAGPFGVAALRQRADGPADITVSADPDDLTRVAVEVLRQPGGGTLDAVPEGGVPTAIPTAGPYGPAWVEVPMPPGTGRLTFTARGDGPVDLLAWTAGNGRPGVTYSNLGTIGARVGIVGRWDPEILATELARLKPALLLVAFGTNEGFLDSTDTGSYPELYAASLRALRAAAPGAAVVVMGPPDGNRRTPRPDGASCGAAGGRAGGEWAVPANLRPVRDAQRAVAAREGAYFWDWSKPMGGDCGMHAWVTEEPPLAMPDHVHLRSPGYRRTAEALFAELTEDYARWRAAPAA